MNIKKLPSEIATLARHALDEVEGTLEHGRDVLVETKDDGLSTVSSMIDSGTRRAHTFRRMVLAYGSLRALASAIDDATPARRVLGAFGLQRRRSGLSQVVLGASILVAGAAAGVGLGLLLAPQSGAKTREIIALRFKTLRVDAKVMAREVETQAREAVHEVQVAAHDLVSNGHQST